MVSELKHHLPLLSIPYPLTPNHTSGSRWRAVLGNSSWGWGGSCLPLPFPRVSVLGACSLAPVAFESSLLEGLPYCPSSALRFVEILGTLIRAGPSYNLSPYEPSRPGQVPHLPYQKHIYPQNKNSNLILLLFRALLCSENIYKHGSTTLLGRQSGFYPHLTDEEHNLKKIIGSRYALVQSYPFI